MIFEPVGNLLAEVGASGNGRSRRSHIRYRSGSSTGTSSGTSGYLPAVEKIAGDMFNFPARKNELKDRAARRVCACPQSSPVRLDD